MKVSVLLKDVKLTYVLNFTQSAYKDFEIKGLTHDSRKAEKDFLVLPPVDFFLPPSTVYSQRAEDSFLSSVWENLGDVQESLINKIVSVLKNAGERGANFFILPEFLEKTLVPILSVQAKKDAEKGLRKFPDLLFFIKNYYKAQGKISRNFYSFPDEKLQIIGISGTNGKTSTTNILYQLMRKGGKSCASLGTLGLLKDDSGFKDIGFTTPFAPMLYKILADLVNEGIEVLVLELSSHGLILGRFAELQLDAFILTTIGQDHLDFHGSMESYVQAKFEILNLLYQSGKKSKVFICGNLENSIKRNLYKYIQKLIINEKFFESTKESPFTMLCVDESRLDLNRELSEEFTAAYNKKTEDVGVENLEKFLNYYSVSRSIRELSIQKAFVNLDSAFVSANLIIFPGALFHIDNTVLAWLCFYFFENKLADKFSELSVNLSAKDKQVEQVDLLDFTPVPGRFELIAVKRKLYKNSWALIDYAHTHDAIESLLKSIKVFSFDAVIIVFGCGGDRDRSKRPLMAQVSERYADRIVITSDNPRTEDAEKIIKEIEKGMSCINYISEVDRRKAIELAYRDLKENEIMLIAGKGHEDYQIIGKKKFHFSDKEEIERLEVEF